MGDGFPKKVMLRQHNEETQFWNVCFFYEEDEYTKEENLPWVDIQPDKSRAHTHLSNDSRQSSPTGLDKRRSSKKKRKQSIEDDLETVLDLSVKSLPYDETGKRTYERACKKLGVVPSSTCMKKLANVTTLDMKNYGLGPKGTMAVAIAMVVNATVTTLNLKGNNIDKKGILYLQRMMTENMTITELDVSENNLRTFGAKAIALMLQENKVIRRLNISGNGFTDLNAYDLAKNIEEHVTLEYVNLSNNSFGDLSGPHFEHMMAENGALLELDLSWNLFRIIGATHLAGGLRDNAYMKVLNLSWNGFDDEGGIKFGEAIGNNNVLKQLDLSCCRIGPEGFTKIINAFRSNEVLNVLRIGKNNISEEAAEAAVEFFKQLPGPCKLEILDMTDVILRPSFQQKLDELAEFHPSLAIVYGYGDSYGKRKMAGTADVGEDALYTIKEYMDDKNLTISELFAKFDDDGSNSVDYDEFRQGIKEAGINLTDYQVDKLIEFVDIDGDGDLDFSELVLKMKEITKKRQAEEEQRKKEEEANKRAY